MFIVVHVGAEGHSLLGRVGSETRAMWAGRGLPPRLHRAEAEAADLERGLRLARSPRKLGFDRSNQLLRFKRLTKHGAKRHLFQFRKPVPRDENANNLRVAQSCHPCQRNAVDALGHHDVCNEHVRLVGTLKQSQRRIEMHGCCDAISSAPEHPDHCREEYRIVINDQNVLAC